LAGTGVFGKQSPGPASCGPLALHPHRGFTLPGRPFSRSYGAKLPSSLTEGLPSTSVCSTSPPVSVCGTGGCVLARGFSRPYGLDPCGLGRSPHLPVTPRSTPPRICLRRLPTGLEGLRPRTYPPASPHRSVTAAAGTGLVTRCPSPTLPSLGLGPPHPQVISMAAEPSGIRWGGFAPPSRYSCRHSHFHPLQVRFRSPFTGEWNAPLPPSRQSTVDGRRLPVGCRRSSVVRLGPRLRRRA
jgi:hypothetical protein